MFSELMTKAAMSGAAEWLYSNMDTLGMAGVLFIAWYLLKRVLPKYFEVFR